MTVHPEIHQLPKEERVRLIAYAIWEEEGRPDGLAEAHWLRACEIVEAEAPDTAAQADPDWLKRNEAVAAETESPAEPKIPLTEAIKRMRNPRAA